ncbi:MAG: chlororespiratory reduction protein 7 [Elainellaceae cyanobacterium]
MVDRKLYETDSYVLLRSQQEEEFVSRDELLEQLRAELTRHPEARSPDLLKFDTLEEQALQLLETSYELVTGPGEFLQWYAVRLEK